MLAAIHAISLYVSFNLLEQWLHRIFIYRIDTFFAILLYGNKVAEQQMFKAVRYG